MNITALNTQRPQVKAVIPILPEEIANFETQVKNFKAGKWDPDKFTAFRLLQGVYGQRQPEVHMMRVKIPFGGLSANQLDALGKLANNYAPLRKGHVTTRENFQFHHINLEDTPDIMRLIGDVGLTTREACGNTVRNVTGCPLAGVCTDEPFDVTPYSAAFARYFVRHPLTQALPRKFKTAFSGCIRDCAITSIHDLGFLPMVKEIAGSPIKGFKIVVGGGTSIMARIAPTLYEFVPVQDYLKVSEAVIRIFHRSDELRKNRMKARIKFLVDRIGIDEFRKLVDDELQQDWAHEPIDPTPLLYLDDEESDAPPPYMVSPHNGDQSVEFTQWLETNVIPQKQSSYMAVYVKLTLGDIQAEQFPELANIARRFAGGRARITHQQNLLFRWVRKEALYDIWVALSMIGLADAGVHEISDVVACPGTDSCKLGITSSMGVAQALQQSISTMEINDPLIKQMHVKISGCPNGCGQHHIANIGLHGAAMKGPTGGQIPAYELFIGGNYDWEHGVSRIGQRLKAKLPAKSAPEGLRKMLEYYQERRLANESFNKFVDRVGARTFEPIIEQFKDVGPINRKNIEKYMDWNKSIIYKVERGEGECAV